MRDISFDMSPEPGGLYIDKIYCNGNENVSLFNLFKKVQKNWFS